MRLVRVSQDFVVFDVFIAWFLVACLVYCSRWFCGETIHAGFQTDNTQRATGKLVDCTTTVSFGIYYIGRESRDAECRVNYLCALYTHNLNSK